MAGGLYNIQQNICFTSAKHVLQVQTGFANARQVLQTVLQVSFERKCKTCFTLAKHVLLQVMNKICFEFVKQVLCP